MNIDALWNLPSQDVSVYATGKIYRQYKLEDIITEYAVTNRMPVERFPANTILHYNEVNFSSEKPTIIGLSKLEALRDPIRNIQALFETMNSLLRTGGAKGIISVDSKDGTGATMAPDPESQKEIDKNFKNDYGLLNNQNPFLFSPLAMTYNRIAMTAKDLGVYEEFSNNAILIDNEFGVPPELIKTYVNGATYENQEQSVKRLYQDTTIPQVAQDDQYTNYKLNLEKYGIILMTDWSHIPVLAENEKEKATSNNLIVSSALKEFEANLITWNQYLTKTKQEPVGESEGKLYKWELDKQRGNNETNNNSNND